MKTIQLLFTLLLGFHLLAEDATAQKFVMNSDSSAAVEAGPSQIMTGWNDHVILDNSFDECTPPKKPENLGIKIFIPDSTLTGSMPILDPPPVDEGIFINFPPYCGEMAGKKEPEEDDEEKEK